MQTIPRADGVVPGVRAAVAGDSAVQRVLARCKPRHLNCLLRILECGSLHEAARQLSVTESAVSKTLRELERLLDTRLFHRLPSGMSPTADGLAFARAAAGAMNMLEHGVRTLRERAGEGRERLRIATMPIASTIYLPELLSRFTRRYVDCTVEVSVGHRAQVMDQLRNGDADLALGRLPTVEDLEGLMFEQFALDDYVFAVRQSHPLTTRARRIKPAWLAPYPLVHPPKETVVWHELQRFLSAHELRPQASVVEIIDQQCAFNYTLCTDAVWLASRTFVSRHPLRRRVVILDMNVRLLEAPIGLILRPQQQFPEPVEYFISLVRELAEPGPATASPGLRRRGAARPARTSG